jgi:hypothetical protein
MTELFELEINMRLYGNGTVNSKMCVCGESESDLELLSFQSSLAVVISTPPPVLPNLTDSKLCDNDDNVDTRII